MSKDFSKTGLALETNPLAIDRVRQIERELQAWADKPIEFTFDPSGTNLYSMEELTRAFAKRAADFTKSIRQLTAADSVIPATVLGRALIETIGMGCLFLHDMDRLILAGDRERFSARLSRFYTGIKGYAIEPVHVMDAIRHLEKIDAEYISYLNDKYNMLSVAAELAKERNMSLSRESAIEALSVIKNYDLLSEVSHPNGTGTQLLYGDPGAADEMKDQLTLRFRQASLASIWQCHHLLRALDKTNNLAERFRTTFIVKQHDI